MPINIPKEPKVYTTKYENFRGVDFTNDSTNVWYRRSPNAVNMLPDDSGTPYKRTGWEIKYTIAYLSEVAGAEIDEIFKCFYFELAGTDHILIFANGGIFAVHETSEEREREETIIIPSEIEGEEDETVTNIVTEIVTEDTIELLDGSTEPACFGNFDRAFFFEGNGRSAFYIYGNSRVWLYEYKDGEFVFHEATDIYIPRLLIGTDPSTCAGTTLESYNMLGNKAKVEYTTNVFFHYVTNGDYQISVNKTTFTAYVNYKGVYTYERVNSAWKYGNTTVNLSDLGVTIIGGTPKDGDKIQIAYLNGVLLPSNVSQEQASDVKVRVSVSTQFDTELSVAPSASTLTASQCLLYTDTISKEGERRAFIRFYNQYVTPLNLGEDLIQVEFPISEINVTRYENIPELELTATAQIQGMKGS